MVPSPSRARPGYITFRVLLITVALASLVDQLTSRLLSHMQSEIFKDRCSNCNVRFIAPDFWILVFGFR
jgi:hypothetical protein